MFSSTYDVIVLGAGAAGMMCAIEAGKRGRRVLVLERNREIGEKIRISGGGRCNFTNIIVESEHYLSSNPHFCRSALTRFTPEDFLRIVDRYGIGYHEKNPGQLFCDGSAREIIRMLRQESSDSGVETLTECLVHQVGRSESFLVDTNKGAFQSESLVVATGGLSVPKLGATDFGHRIASQFGLSIVAPKAGLVPLVFQGAELEFCRALSGVSVDARVECNGQFFRGNILFTHRGLSGPAILQISSYWNPGDAISLDLSPETDLETFLKERHDSESGLATILSEVLPRRVAGAWCEMNRLSGPIRRCPVRELVRAAQHLHHWILFPSGTEGFAKAEVTCGGVNTDELSSKSMESRKVKGLFFIGEVVDVTGHLGGYNFQWAWASGFAAGQFV